MGNAPGHGGSRRGLRRRARPAVPRGGQRRGSPQARPTVTQGPIHDTATARALVRDARAAGTVLRWRPGFTKSGKSGERYQFHSRARTFAQFDALSKEAFVSGSTGGNRLKATLMDLLFDAARGTVTSIDAATPPEAAPGGNEPADSDDDPPTRRRGSNLLRVVASLALRATSSFRQRRSKPWGLAGTCYDGVSCAPRRRSCANA